jgi:hypothetical protein
MQHAARQAERHHRKPPAEPDSRAGAMISVMTAADASTMPI